MGGGSGQDEPMSRSWKNEVVGATKRAAGMTESAMTGVRLFEDDDRQATWNGATATLWGGIQNEELSQF